MTRPADSDERLMAALAESTLALCRIASVTGDEARIADFLESRCRQSGAAVERRGQTVLARGPALPGRPCIALFGHSDTVPPASGQPIGIDGGRVYGTGASDMKGGLAVMLALLESACGHSAPLFDASRANLLCVFYDREEGPIVDNGLVPLCQSGALAGIDLAICLEPTDSIIHAGCMGGIQARVTIPGKRAHSARPWQGENAIYAALPLLAELRQYSRREVQISGLPFYEVLVATQAETHNSRNVVPDRFTLNLNYRYAPGKSREQARSELSAFVKSAAGPVAESLRIELIDESPSGAVWIEEPRFAAWQQRCGLAVAAKQAWTDVAQLSELGIPALNFGPGETAEAHQANESVAASALLHALKSLAVLLEQPSK